MNELEKFCKDNNLKLTVCAYGITVVTPDGFTLRRSGVKEFYKEFLEDIKSHLTLGPRYNHK